MTLNFDIIPDFAGLINETYNVDDFTSSTSITFEVPDGIYDIWVGFSKPVPGYENKVVMWVVYENVSIEGTFDTLINSTDAKNKVELNTYNENGILLNPDLLSQKDDRYFLRFPSNFPSFSLVYLFNLLYYPFNYVMVSDLSDRYQIWTARQLRSEANFYQIKNYPISNGLFTDTILTNTSNDYTLLEQSFQLSPGAGENCYAVVDELITYMGAPVLGIEHVVGELLPYSAGDIVNIFLDNQISELTVQNGMDYFASPTVWEGEPDHESPKKIQSELLIVDETKNVIDVGRWYNSFDFALQKRNIFPFHDLSYNLGQSPSYKLGVEAPFAYCQSLNTFGGMVPNLILCLYNYLGQYDEFRKTDNFNSNISIKHDGNIIFEDVLSNFIEPLITETSAIVEETLTNENFLISGFPGSTITVLTFDQNNTDCDPPTLTTFRIFSQAGEISNTVSSDENAMVMIAAADFSISEDFSHYIYKSGAAASLSYKNSLSENWIDLTLTEQPESFDSLYGKVYTSQLQDVFNSENDSAFYDFKVTLTDGQGNTFVETWHPALLVINTLTSPWPFTITGLAHTVNVPATANPNIFGEPLEPGDWVGVFFMDEEGSEVCGGAAEIDDTGAAVVTAYGNDATTPEKDGFASGESFRWKIYDAS
nr:hypothetical protein [Bacteroidota bacterium]